MIILIIFFAVNNIYARDITDAAGLRSFLGARGSGDEIILTKDVELTETIKIKSGNIVLDLDGKSIYNKWGWTNSNKKKIDIFDVEGGTLTIQGSGKVYTKSDNNPVIKVIKGTLNINGGELFCEDSKVPVVDVLSGGKLVLNKGSIKATYFGLLTAGSVDVIPLRVNGGTVEMKGGSINAESSTDETIGVKVVSGSFSMLDGDIKASCTSGNAQNATGLMVESSGNVSLKQGTLSASANYSKGRSIRSSQPFSSICVAGYGIYKDNELQSMNNTETQGSIEIKPITYTIFYKNLDNATVIGSRPSSYTIESPDITISATAAKDYYDFKGWRLDNTVDKKITIPKGSTGDKTLTAVWKGKEYNIHYNLNGGENSANNKPTYTYSTESAVPLYDPSRSYYTFENWYKDQSLTTLFGKEIPKGQSGELNLYAKWKAVSYPVRFYDGDVELTDYEKSRSVEKGIPANEMPKPAKDGYVFLYWANNGQKMESVPAGHTDLSLKAEWKEVSYKVKYISNGGTELAEESYTKTTVSDRVWKTEQHIKKDGYVFKGWFLKSDLSGEPLKTFPLNMELGSVSQDQTVVAYTFYAKWELKSYSIVFQNCEGVDNKKYNVNEGVSKDKMPKPNERNGYKFIGWYDNEGVLVESIEKGTGDIYLTAKWDPIEYTIKYVTNGGTISGEVTKYTIEQKVDLKTPTRDNYTFAGWYTDSQLNNRFDSEVLIQAYGDKTFYAKWSPKTYTLTLNPTGGRISQTEQKYVYGEVTKFARKPYRENYIFDGWYYDEACTKAYGDEIKADNSGDHTLYAKWKLIEYEIILDCYNGEFPAGTKVPEAYTYESVVTSLPKPVRQGFSFAGWYADDLLTKPVSSPVIKKGESGPKKFYATWDRGYQVIFTQPSHGKITVTWNGKAMPAGAMIGKGESLTVTAEATDANYVLKQLVINDKPYTSSPQQLTMPGEDLKITAEFTETSVPAASAPKITLTPSGVDKFPKGEDVKVRLSKTDEATTLYYSVGDSPEKAYNGEFLVSSPEDTVLLKAIARKEGYRDGVATRYIIYDNGKISLTFDLPLGVKAINPTGGDVVTATTTGGSFEFKLTVDRDYYTNLDSMVVSANDSVIQPGASGLYTLTDCSSDITITVTGLKAKVCTVTLQQTENGQISFTDGAEETTTEVEYGETVSITAKADEDFKFLQWNTGNQSNPLKLTVKKDTTISARFISDYKAYAVTLPQLEGVKVKPFTGYSTEVKKDGTFKFYLQLTAGYREENLVVRANGEELVKNKGGYAIFHIDKNISISVEGIVREPVALEVPENVQAKVVETMTDPAGEHVYGETMLLLHAKAPAGKTFSKWTDGKTDNPRLATVQDAAQLHPLFVDKEDENYAKVTLNQSPGAGITAVNANIDGVKKDETVQLKVVLLPAYSQSEVTLTVDDKEVKPDISLRAASETKTYVFLVPVDKDDMTVKVAGMKRNTYHVSVAQTDGGAVSATPGGEIAHGDTVRLTARPESGMLFVKWWDGNTLNPYPYPVTSDMEVKAYFVGTESTVDNESVRKEEKGQIAIEGNRLFIKVDKESQGYIFNFGGRLYQKMKIPAGGYWMYLPDGEYVIKVGEDMVRKVIIR